MEEIGPLIREKELKYLNKWGNKSKVGAIINDYKTEILTDPKFQPSMDRVVPPPK